MVKYVIKYYRGVTRYTTSTFLLKKNYFPGRGLGS